MAGHSKWANIKRTKEANDKKKSKNFSKISKEIMIAARVGQNGDLGTNILLKSAVDKAKQANMPNENIQKAINKGLGISNVDEIIYESTYEAYTSEGIPLLIDVETDNKNRTYTELRTIVTRAGGKMLPEGSISWQFNEFGKVVIVFDDKNKSSQLHEEIILQLLEVGDVLDYESSSNDRAEIIFMVYVKKEDLRNFTDKLRDIYADKLNIESVEVVKKIDAIYSKEIPSNAKGGLESLVDDIEENISEVVGVWSGIS